MTAALEEVSGQQRAPAALYTRERTGTDFTGRWVDFRAGLEVSEDLVSTGIRSRTVHLVVSRYTVWGIRPLPIESMKKWGFLPNGI